MSNLGLWLFGGSIVALTLESGLIALALCAAAVWCVLA